MRTPDTMRSLQHVWMLGLAVLSLAVPIVAIFLLQGPVLPFTDPAQLRYYRQTVAALIFGLLCAAVAIVGARRMFSPWLRWLTAALAGFGVMIGAALLWLLVGSCGPRVLWGLCQP